MRIHLIHGIHTGAVSTVQDLIPYLKAEGLDVAYPDYGWIFGVETRFLNPTIRGALFPYVDRGDVLIGHSNGAAIAYDLMNAGAPIAGAVFINAALEPRITRAAGVEWIDVYYNPSDDLTLAAEIAEKLHIVDPVWGEMGHSGYKGVDPLIASYNCGATTGLPVVKGHSDFFTTANLTAWGPVLAKRLKDHLTPIQQVAA